ncbi:hypothetical protein GQ44DRAFT_713080 [Phaeosphaeriaceae sp. PMI808]|nr:hypothetical protein GQ44DRAFT_713080 [Phaeosphaeriaceae sp. PMI808]
MPPSTRVPMAEFRSLLLPPIRVSTRSFSALFRPQCLPDQERNSRPSPCVAQRRYLCLYKTARAQTTLGMHKIIPFSRYNIAPPKESTHEVDLAQNDQQTTTVSLQELYDNHIKPGRMLYLRHGMGKNSVGVLEKLQAGNLHNLHKQYGVLEAFSIPRNVKPPNEGKGIGALRVTPVSLSSPEAYFKLAMDRSYQFIYHGSPVEFSVRYSGAGGGKGKKAMKLKAGDPDAWPWVHNHFPHLRPDFILKSMPEGSVYKIDPVTDGRVLQFVIFKPSKNILSPENLTHRLFKVKNSVQRNIDHGQQAMLPGVLRQELLEGGNKSYSPMSGMPVQFMRGAKHLEGEAKASQGLGPSKKYEKEHWSMGRTVRKKHQYEPQSEKARLDTLSKSGGLKHAHIREYKERAVPGEKFERTSLPGAKMDGGE